MARKQASERGGREQKRWNRKDKNMKGRKGGRNTEKRACARTHAEDNAARTRDNNE